MGGKGVASGVKTIGNDVVPGYSFGYGFDAIGNRTSATVNGHTSNYQPNSLNQIESRTVPGFIDITGSVGFNSADAVFESAAVREWQTSQWLDARVPELPGDFFAQFAVPSQNGYQAREVEISATVQTEAGTQQKEVRAKRPAFVSETPEMMTYDDDGNLLQDGFWDYEWDAENRLVRQTARRVWGLDEDGPNGGLPPGWLASEIRNEYDHLGRRVMKEVYREGLWGVSLMKRVRFVWDDWNIVLETEESFPPPALISDELNDPNDPNSGFVAVPGLSELSPRRSSFVSRGYTWGDDLSGTMSGAGGVGGLLHVHINTWEQSSTQGVVTTVSELLPWYDGNGNIMGYVDAATGAVEQEEEYGPFGESLRPRSTSLKRVPFGWSTKYTDEETGLVAYQLRYYNAELGRWMSRDLIEERGGVNMYGFCVNAPSSCIDYIGYIVFSNGTTYNQLELAAGKALQASTFALDGKGGFYVKPYEQMQGILKDPAKAHEQRHIDAIKRSNSINAVPYKQVFWHCPKNGGDPFWGYLAVKNGKISELVVKPFNNGENVLWPQDTMTLFKSL